MKLTQVTFRGEPVFIPFAELGEKYAKIDMDKPFKRSLSCGRSFEMCRSDYNDAPCCMVTDIISDKAMDNIATALKQHLDSFIDAQTDDEEFDDAFWHEEENILVEIGVPYYEDDEPTNYKKGDRVFYKDGKNGFYATIIKNHPKHYEITIKSDYGKTLRVQNCDVIKEF
jgi:hypothetical protein